MAVYKCKMCGGELNVADGRTTCECEFCGTKQTVPTVDDDVIRGLFNRANVLRMKSEFDKAAEIYERILQQKEDEPEAYWGLILCKYGIEYVEDPKTFQRIPTCHRASYDAVVSDEDYKNALKYADPVRKELYQKEAARIDEIQRDIIAIAQKNDPYDVFICYKETDENGKRTQDSVIANDIYYQLKREGFKVFYAAISLEDKLGTEYEPHIFSALNTAKVMLVLGTKPEYFNAVWVKNEWSRFLKIMKKDRSKLLIPCFKDMDSYELPEEFAHLQAQDMGKIGFINDVTRGIKKVLETKTEKPEEAAIAEHTGATSSSNAQVKRGMMALEDGEWQKADTFFEQALDYDPECAEAYLGKWLAGLRQHDWNDALKMLKGAYAQKRTERLQVADAAAEGHIAQMVSKYAVPGYLEATSIGHKYDYDFGYDSALSDRKQQKARQLEELGKDKLLVRTKQYAAGVIGKQLEDGLAELTATLDERVEQAKAEDTESIAAVKTKYQRFLEKTDGEVIHASEEAKQQREQDYISAVEQMKKASSASAYAQAKAILEKLQGYKDSRELAAKCQEEIDRIQKELKEAAEKQAKKEKQVKIIAVAAVIIVAALAMIYVGVIVPNGKYNAAVALMESGDYEGAIAAFEAMDGYKDSAEQITACETAILNGKYNAAVALMESGDYEGAITAFKVLEGYKDSVDQIEQCSAIITPDRIADFVNVSVGDTIAYGFYEQDNDTSNGKEDIEWVVLAKEGNQILVISKYALDCQQYNTSYTGVTWAISSLRKWMNGTFLNEAFTNAEQAYIPTVTVTADKNPNYSTSAGNDTQDRVFLLSVVEAEKYFSSDSARQCEATAYAKAQGAYTSSSTGNCWWWLRSPGLNSNNAASVRSGGSVYCNGFYVDYGNDCVRPALWINLAS